MDKEDGRKLSPDAQHERRKQVIRLHRRGVAVSEIVMATGQSNSGVRKTIATYDVDGWKGLACKQRGRRAGQQRTLSAEQEADIRQIICDKRPEQLRMRFALWTREAVGQLIANRLKIELPVRSVGHYLKRWGFTPQKPIRRVYERYEPAVQSWLNEVYPTIAARAKVENAEIHWGDESALVNTDVRGRGFAPKGKTPLALHPAKRETLSMISTVTNQGTMRWMIIESNFNADCLIEFLDALVRSSARKVFLILDNLSVHHSRPVKAWLAERKDQIEVFYLPAYSPELNPDERLNADLKQQLGSRIQARSKEKLRSLATWRLQQLQQQPERIKTYFQDPRCRYAA